MLRGRSACERVGFPPSHAAVFQRVATRMNTVISCREVGKVCTGLIEDGYALKGFRVDTKSCNWGPMAGFVCMDPRLNKAVYEKEAFNRAMTEEALSGAIHKTGGTEGQDLALLTAEWKANYHPLVISQKRLDQLVTLKAIGALQPEPAGVEIRKELGTPGFFGTSTAGGLTIKWHLVRLRPGRFEGVTDHYGIFVEATKDFTPEYLGGAKPLTTSVPLGHMRYAVWHALLGLTNPIARGRNTRFKDCVTGDYDLFGVWPMIRREAQAPLPRPSERELQMAIARRNMPGGIGNTKVGNFPDQNWDVRPQDRHLKQDEHYQLGNISRRVNLIKVMLNTELQAEGEAVGAKSQLVHHSDEVGNPDALLAKPLIDCLPIIGFIPGEQEAYTMETMFDLQTFVGLSRGGGFSPHLKPDWRSDLS